MRADMKQCKNKCWYLHVARRLSSVSIVFIKLTLNSRLAIHADTYGRMKWLISRSTCLAAIISDRSHLVYA